MSEEAKKRLKDLAKEVRDKVNTVLRELPTGIEQPIISKVEPSAAPVLYLGVRGKGQSMRDLTEVADKKVRRQLESIIGVGKVTLIGGRERQIHVRMDPLALRAAREHGEKWPRPCTREVASTATIDRRDRV